MTLLAKLTDGRPSATKSMIQLAIASFSQLGINLQDIQNLTPFWSPEGQFLLELQTSKDLFLFLYHDGEVLLAKGDYKKAAQSSYRDD
ncbi:MAG: hypothetical protein ACFFC7_12900 [Candidatus Hermodarchaeota archaeon]